MAEKHGADLTFQGAIKVQCDYMLGQAQRVQERGYCVILSNLNPDLQPETLKFPYGYMSGGFSNMMRTWNSKRGTHYLSVYVRLLEPEKMFDGGLTFKCDIPNRFWSRELIASLQVVSKFRKWVKTTDPDRNRKYIWRGHGLFQLDEGTETYEVVGANKAALESFLRILEMPQHRKLLLGNSRAKL